MEMVGHECVGMDGDIVARGLVSKELQEETEVGRLTERFTLVVAALHYMQG
jgi:hypothetical protein